MADRLRKLVGGSFNGVKIAAWGLSFKAGTDDTRESPAFRILAEMVGEGAVVTAFDPAVKTPPPAVELAGSALEACDGAEALIVLTEWPELGAYRRRRWRPGWIRHGCWIRAM